MSLQQLNKKIHQASKSELVANLASFKIDIANALNAGESEAYYKNHTGRELYRKLHNFGLGSEIISIGDAHDNGFRPLTVVGIKSSIFDSASLFDPSDLYSSVVVGWYDASDLSTITHSNGVVSAWADKSSSSNDLTGNAKAGSNPTTGTSTQNSLNVINLDGGDFFKKDVFLTPTSGNLQAFIVCSVDASNHNADAIISMDAASNDWQIGAGNANQFRGILTFDSQPDGSTTSGSNNGLAGFRIFCADLDFTDDGKYQLLVDGKTLTGTDVRTYSAKLASSVELYLFANRSENKFPEGKIAEVLILDNTNDLTRQRVEGYLAHKWGIENLLPSSHPHLASAPVQPILFDASDITTLAWYDSNDSSTITKNSSNFVSQWDDKSGNDNHAIQSNSALQPADANLGDGIEFDGSDDGFVLTSTIITENASIYVVMKGDGYVFANANTSRILFADVQGHSSIGYQNLFWTIDNQDAIQNKDVSGHDAAKFQILEFNRNGQNVSVRVNGVFGYNATSKDPLTSYKKIKIDRIGVDWDKTTNVGHWDGNILEIIVTENTSDREKIEGYLAHKWGLEGDLADDHPYKFFVPER